MVADKSELPIGVFDSGIGGLTVLKVLAEKFPDENFVYLGDTARLPYGAKSPDTIYKYSDQIIDYLITYGVKAIVIACNSASANYPLKEKSGIPIFNVIEPGAIAAARTTESKKIGVLGTRATIKSGAYQKAIAKILPEAQIFSQACPLFVPLAEEGLDQDPITNLIVFRYLQPILAERVDTLVLGCTHYPLLKNSIHRAATNSITLVDSGIALSEILNEAFETQIILKSQAKLRPKAAGAQMAGIAPDQVPKNRVINVMITDNSDHFVQLATNIMLPLKLKLDLVNL